MKKFLFFVFGMAAFSLSAQPLDDVLFPGLNSTDKYAPEFSACSDGMKVKVERNEP